MSRVSRHLLLFALITSGRASIIPIDTDVVKKSIVFLYSAGPGGGPDLNKSATGFLIAVPSKADPARPYFALVTARHVVDPVWACTSNINPDMMYARVNRKGYDPKQDESGVEYIRVDLIADGKMLWATHPSGSVDAAVIPVDSAKFLQNDISAINITEFGTPEEIKSVGIGDDVVSAGLIPELTGKNRNYPFFKFGKISNIPEEQGFLPCRTATKPLDIWYLAATLVGGNSGSPIFFLPTANVPLAFTSSRTPTRPFLLGIQSMSLATGEIAGMTPVQYLFEILESLHLPDADLTRGASARPMPQSKK